MKGNLELKPKEICKMCSISFFFPSRLDLLALACSFVFSHGNASPSCTGLPACVPECAPLNWESVTDCESNGCISSSSCRGTSTILEIRSKAATFDPFLELLVIVFLGDPTWRDFPVAVCCLAPAVRLSHNKLLQTHSFP